MLFQNLYEYMPNAISIYVHADLITSDSANLYFMLIYSNIAE